MVQINDNNQCSAVISMIEVRLDLTFRLFHALSYDGVDSIRGLQVTEEVLSRSRRKMLVSGTEIRVEFR